MPVEFELIERIFSRLTGHGPDVLQGIGDDCALVRVPDGQCLALTTDTLVEGVHFPAATAPGDIGWKALACSLSDLAAAGAEPRWATLALTLPEAAEDWLQAFAGGFAALAGEAGVSLVGGDLVYGPTLGITVQAGGHVPAGSTLRRDGARPGEGIYISGGPGEAAAGLAAVRSGHATGTGRLTERLNRPTPRTRLGIALRDRASACIDVSDGLAADLGHILAASGCGADLELEALPISEALAMAGDREQVMEWVLHGGDDYELCFCMPDDNFPAIRELPDIAEPITRIGTVRRTPGLRLAGRDQRTVEVPPRGHDHFPPAGS